MHDNNGISPNTNTYVKLNMMVMNSTQFYVQPGPNMHISSPSRHQHMPFSMRASWRRPRGNSRDQTAHSRMKEKQAKALKICKFIWHVLYMRNLGGWGGNLRLILVRVCGPVFFKPTPIIYLVFEKKNDPFVNFPFLDADVPRPHSPSWFKHIYFKSVHTIQYYSQSYKH